MAKKRSKKGKGNDQKTNNASDLAKKLSRLQRTRNFTVANQETQHRSAIETKKNNGFISDEETDSDPNITSSYVEKYHEEKFKNIESKIEAASNEKIHALEKFLTISLGDFKSEILRWFVGLIIVILLGLIGFHYSSLSNISAEIRREFEGDFQKILLRISLIEKESQDKQHTRKEEKPLTKALTGTKEAVSIK